MTERIALPEDVRDILDRLDSSGEKAYVVGGCVRDSIMGKCPHDWDICTSATPEKVQSLFRHCIPTGLKHGTVTVVINGKGYEVTTFRAESQYSDMRHPDEVTYTRSVEEDLARRDFTMNAIAYSPAEGLVDPYGGEENIQRRTISCVGNPAERFREDPLRILRAIRFMATSWFSIAPETKFAILGNAPSLRAVSRERQQVELMRMLPGKNVGRVLMEYKEALGEVVPALRPCFGFQQKNPCHIYDVWEHTVVAIEESPQDPVVRLALLFHDIGKPVCYQDDRNGVRHFHGHGAASAGIANAAMQSLRFDNKTRKTVVELVGKHDQFIESNYRSVRKLLGEMGPGQFERLMELRRADVLAQAPEYIPQRRDKVDNLKVMASKILSQGDCVNLKQLAVNGNDLIAAGMPPGPKVKATLHSLLEMVLADPALNTREALLKKGLANCHENS